MIGGTFSPSLYIYIKFSKWKQDLGNHISIWLTTVGFFPPHILIFNNPAVFSNLQSVPLEASTVPILAKHFPEWSRGCGSCGLWVTYSIFTKHLLLFFLFHLSPYSPFPAQFPRLGKGLIGSSLSCVLPRSLNAWARGVIEVVAFLMNLAGQWHHVALFWKL